MKRVKTVSGEWGDPYPCGMLTTVTIGGKEIGSYSGGDPCDYQELARKSYKQGFEDGLKEKEKK